MTQTANDLLHEIFACPNVSRCLSQENSLCPCAGIVRSQGKNDFQRPEPWSGNLDKSKILFISPRPSIDPDELYPVLDSPDWPDDRISDFFMNRFQGEHKQWVNDDLCVLRKNGKYGERSVQTWEGIGHLAEELLGKMARFGIDFTLTHVVHCKSTEQKLATKAASECAGKYNYLSRIIENNKEIKIIIVLGNDAKDQIIKYVLKLKTAELGDKNPFCSCIGDRKRAFVFVPSPSARCSDYGKSIKGNISDNDFKMLKSLLHS